MDDWYNDYHKRAKDMEYHVHDQIDNHEHPQARLVREELRKLTEDFEQRRNPLSIEARMQTIQRQLMQSQHSNDHFMSVDDSVSLHHQLEHMRQEVKHHPHQ